MGLIVLAFVAHIIFTKAVMDNAEEKIAGNHQNQA